MSKYLNRTLTIYRRKIVETLTGYARSTLYLRITQGLWPKPVSLGARSVGWSAHEVDAVNAARIAGRSDDQIRELVRQLEERRKNVMSHLANVPFEGGV